MDDGDRITDRLDRLPPDPEGWETEELLKCAVAQIATMPAEHVAILRRHVGRMPAGPGRDTLAELIDGHLAMRALRGCEPSGDAHPCSEVNKRGRKA